VTGTGSTFMQTVVVPHLQDTIVAISQTNPPPTLSNGVTHLSGTLVVSGSGTIPASGDCGEGTWSAGGGGILNATVQGDIQKPGTYPVSFSSPGFAETITVSSITCAPPLGTIPGNTQTVTVPPLNENDSITVVAGFAGNALTLGSPAQVPAGCSGGTVTGTDVGAANPLITMSVSISCSAAGGSFTVQGTAKLVGSP